MAGGADIDEEDGITDINVTPFVDVMLVLLIIFMVTANYINTPGIDLNLPEAETGAGLEQSQLTFTIDRNSVIYVDGKAVNEAGLASIVKSKKAEDPKIQATIAADQSTPHGAVIKLIDLVRKNGITDFAINVEAGQ
ncbi:ExbD/TolR family protein [Pseudobacteriovorax antillogorgiicola]|uniref:Outer membrane transport energization protein ExbD n=1 Tax=Pseudobacteriovorax antillogorgiicola TaxID=1513793 RepID=A0A1Y6C3A9_9BACT|nr:biopolymer transporter ExbD [Pseudobacteriovorax antillogorgiicola]TCS50641.1 outer membrane transport energization protein ExbD [Pseudobacteriovorax antillogorgiicola]SMF39597.1 outer membrane transport energization protein ExbD [Pseudobacteriovorax antillogorgiicola]